VAGRAVGQARGVEREGPIGTQGGTHQRFDMVAPAAQGASEAGPAAGAGAGDGAAGVEGDGVPVEGAALMEQGDLEAGAVEDADGPPGRMAPDVGGAGIG